MLLKQRFCYIPNARQEMTQFQVQYRGHKITLYKLVDGEHVIEMNKQVIRWPHF